MLDSINWKELVGYLAPIFIIASMSQSVVKRIRIFMILGCLTFVIYGILVGAWPVVVANAMIGIVTLYYYSRSSQDIEHQFQLIPPEDLLTQFLSERKEAIDRRHPDPFPLGSRYLMIAKGVNPVGLFAYHPLPGANVEILIDYIEPAYRDAKTAALLYCEGEGFLKKKGYKRAIVREPTALARKEFLSMGFGEEGHDLVRDL